MRIRYVAIVFLYCALFTVASVQNTSAEPSELKFDDTYSGPYVDKVLYKVLGSESSQVQALLDNQIDVLGGPISDSYYDTLDAAEDIELSSILRNGYGLITINCRDAPLNWTALRRAFAFAYDKIEVQTDVFQGRSQLHDSLVPYANNFFCYEDDLPYHYYDPEIVLGNQLLNESGFDYDPVSGYRNDPNGNPIHIVIAYFIGSSVGGGCAHAGVDALRALGISAESNMEDFNTYIGNMYNHGYYQMIVRAENFDNYDVDWLAYQYWSNNTDEYMLNPSNFVNDTFDDLRDQLINGTTYAEVYSAASEMQGILHYNVPELIVYENYHHAAYRTDRYDGHVVDINKNIGNEWTNLKAHLNLLEGGPFSGTLRVGMMEEPSSFNPMTTFSPYSKMLFTNMFNSLLRTSPDGTRRFDLAESYTVETHDSNPSIVDGHTRFTFDIIQNASWSDGTPVTADDIVYTFTYYYESSVYGNPIGQQLTDLVAAYSPLPSRVVLEFSTESYWLLSSITDIVILQKTLLQSIGYSGWNTWNPVFSSDPYPTSGPFDITNISPGSYYELSYHTNYHQRVRGIGSDVPVIEEQSDFSVVESPYVQELSWNVIDDNPLVYRIYHNETLIEASYYDQSPITVSLVGYSLGPHNFTLIVQDYEYQNATDRVTVTVIPDTFNPEINGSLLVELYEGSTEGVTINWTVFDHNPSSYTIDMNGTEVLNDTWNWGTDMIFYSLGDLNIANYSYTLTVRDTLGHSVNWSILVSVTERPLFITLESLVLIGAGVAVVVVVVGVFVMKKRR